MTENPAAAAAVDPDTAARLLSGAYHDPHAILGAHATPRGTVLRTLKPGATAVAAVIGGESYPLAQLQGALWGAEVPITELADYRYEVLYPAGSTVVADGYRFLPTIGELDQHLISEGRHERLWDVLGAHLRSYTTPDGEVTGTSFAVWAPNARGVTVIGDFEYWSGESYPMRTLGSSGVWEVFVPGVGEGAAYTWLLNASALAGFIVWAGIAWTHYCFRRAFKAQGRPLSELPFRSRFFPAGPIVALIMCLLSKDPAQRPENATTLASAVDSIRRNDLRAAVKSVPGLAPYLDLGSEDPTQAMTAPTEALGDAPTRTFGSGAAAGAATHPSTASLPAVDQQPRSLEYQGGYDGPGSTASGKDGKRRGPWRWLVPLLVLIVAIAVGVALLLTNGASGDDDPGTQPTQGTVTSASAEPTQAQESSSGQQTVQVRSSDYEGRKLDAVVSELSGKGLSVKSSGQRSDQDANTVLGVSPEGQLAVGSDVTVTYSTGPGSVTLPSSMEGRDADTVIDEITSEGVNVTRHDEASDSVGSGKVIRTSPSAGSTVEVGSSVDVYVSTGPASGDSGGSDQDPGSGRRSTSPSASPSPTPTEQASQDTDG